MVPLASSCSMLKVWLLLSGRHLFLVYYAWGQTVPLLIIRVKQRAGRRAGRQLQSSLTKSTTFGLTLLSTFLLCFARPQVENVVAEHHLVSFTLLTILIGQGHISKVVIVAQIFKAHPYHSYW